MPYLELDVGLSDEAKAMQEMAMKLAAEVIRPAGRELDELTDPEEVVAPGSRLWDVIRQVRGLGFHKLQFSGECGGLMEETDPRTGPLLTEALGYGDAGIASGLDASLPPFKVAATCRGEGLKDLARKFCDDSTAKMIGCCIPVDRTSAGRVSISDDEIAIEGARASWVANGSIATHALVLIPPAAGNGDGKGGVAVIPLDLDGIVRGKALGKMGQRALNKADVELKDVKVPRQWIVTADPNKASGITTAALAQGHVGQGQICVGLAQAALDESHAYARDRIQGGVPIIQHINIKLKLFAMFAMVESSRALARRVGLFSSADPGGSCAHAMALRAVAAENAFKVSSEAIQVFGGNGLAKEYPVEKMLRDARAAMIENGTNEALALAACELIP